VTHGRNRAVDQVLTIISVLIRWQLRQPGPMQGTEQPFSTSIAGKHSSRSIGSVGTWSKPDDQNFCTGRPKIRHWFSPIRFFTVGSTLNSGDGLAMLYQTRATTTSLNRMIQFVPR
jgi:hypothetical protein